LSFAENPLQTLDVSVLNRFEKSPDGTEARGPVPLVGPTGGPPDISVIIPAYHGAATIAACLASVVLAVQGRRSEIILVDSSGDGCGAIVREQFPEVTLILSPTRLSAGGARNAGMARAQGKFLFFVDQDCQVPADWIAGLERHFADPSVGGVGGSLGMLNPAARTGSAIYFLEFFRHLPTDSPPQRNPDFLLGSNCAYRADVLRAVSFPDQTLGEDVLVSHLVCQQGVELVYDPSVEVLHTNRVGKREFLRYNMKMGSASAAYQMALRQPRSLPFLWFPALAFLAPFIILPMIFVRVLRCRRPYLGSFLLLLPVCFVGNMVWAAAFRRRVLASRRRQ